MPQPPAAGVVVQPGHRPDRRSTRSIQPPSKPGGSFVWAPPRGKHNRSRRQNQPRSGRGCLV